MSYTKKGSAAGNASSDTKPLNKGGQTDASGPGAGIEQFYELEIAEVVDIILDEEHPDWMKVDDIGMAKLRPIVSEQDAPKEELIWYSCMDTNIKEYPLIGEYVITCEGMGRNWYSSKVNVMSSVNNNCLFHFTEGTKKDHGFIKKDNTGNDYNESEAAGAQKGSEEEYKPGDLFYTQPMIQPLKAFEGHTMFNGRFGQSIRFGSRARLDTQDGFQDKAGSDPYVSPHILIRTAPLIDAEDNSEAFNLPGKPLEENIDDDGSSIWLTTQEDVPLTLSTAEGALPPFESIEQPEAYDGKQVIINTDRIIFNTKQNQFMCFSLGDQYFNTDAIFAVDASDEIRFNSLANIDVKTESDFLVASKNNVNIDGSSNINFGDSTGELIAKGETLVDILSELIDAVKQSISPSGAIAGPYPVSLVNPAPLEAVKAKLSTILSDRVTTI